MFAACVETEGKSKKLASTDAYMRFVRSSLFADVGQVKSMAKAFSFASNFNGNIGGWNVESVEELNAMFSRALVFNGNLGNWNVSSVSAMSSVFAGALAFEGTGLENWDVTNVISYNSMFAGARAFNIDLAQWVSKWRNGFGYWILTRLYHRRV